jgi:hypothetical protein
MDNIAIKTKLDEVELDAIVQSLKRTRNQDVRPLIKKLSEKLRKVRSNTARSMIPCAACLKTFKSNSELITRHHLVPKASFVSNEERLATQSARPTIRLCVECHNLVHRELGDGHEFRGPTTRRHLIRWIRLKRDKI